MWYLRSLLIDRMQCTVGSKHRYRESIKVYIMSVTFWILAWVDSKCTFVSWLAWVDNACTKCILIVMGR